MKQTCSSKPEIALKLHETLSVSYIRSVLCQDYFCECIENNASNFLLILYWLFVSIHSVRYVEVARVLFRMLVP